MTDSTLGRRQQNENLQPNVESNQSLGSNQEKGQTDPVQTVVTGLGVVSGGLAGAMIGRLVAGRFGAAVGAVVGGVAGANVGREAAEGVEQKLSGVTDAVKQNLQQTVNELKTPVIETVDAVKHNVEAAQPSVIGAIDSVRETIDESRPAVTEAIHAVTETVDEARPSVVRAADSVSATVEETQPAVREAIQKTSENIQTSTSDIAGSVQRAARTAADKLQDTQRNISERSASVTDREYTQDQNITRSDWETRRDENLQTDMNNQASGDIDAVIILDSVDEFPSMNQSMMSSGSAIGTITDQDDLERVRRMFDRGITLSNQGNLTEAEQAFSQVVDLMPDLPEAHFNLGVILLQLNRETEGLFQIEQARDLSRFQGDMEATQNLDRILEQIRSAR